MKWIILFLALEAEQTDIKDCPHPKGWSLYKCMELFIFTWPCTKTSRAFYRATRRRDGRRAEAFGSQSPAPYHCLDHIRAVVLEMEMSFRCDQRYISALCNCTHILLSWLTKQITLQRHGLCKCSWLFCRDRRVTGRALFLRSSWAVLLTLEEFWETCRSDASEIEGRQPRLSLWHLFSTDLWYGIMCSTGAGLEINQPSSLLMVCGLETET